MLRTAWSIAEVGDEGDEGDEWHGWVAPGLLPLNSRMSYSDLLVGRSLLPGRLAQLVNCLTLAGSG